MDGICRLCGEQDLKVMDIYSEEGLQDDIPNKIEMYIPKTILDPEEVPYACCLPCISNILSWHDFVIKVIETNQRISSLKDEVSSSSVNNNDFEQRIEHSPEDPSCIIKETDFKQELIEVGEESGHYETFVFISCDESPKEDKKRLVSKIPSEGNFKENDQSTSHCRGKNEIENKFFCDICDRPFTRKGDMQRHQKLIHGIDPTIPENKIRNKKLIEKCRIVSNGETIYKCDICEHTTKQSYNLIRHQTLHTGEKPYVCHICGKRFRLGSTIRTHLKRFHEGVKNHKCDICFKTFGCKTARDEHMNTHSGDRPYACDICQKSFKQKASLYVHKLYHEENFKFECTICDKKFRRAQELAIHDRIHSGHRPYSCDICNAQFRRSQDLRRHEKIHLKNDLEWVCQICESSFTQERYLKRHKKVHGEVS